jgi:hypothetical protein
MRTDAARTDAPLAPLNRRAVHLPADGQVRIEMPDLKLELKLRDLGFDGFNVVAPRPFWKGMTHWFTFTARSGESVTLVAKAVHCQALPDKQAFVTGWEFMRGSAERTEAAIAQLLDALAEPPAGKLLD